MTAIFLDPGMARLSVKSSSDAPSSSDLAIPATDSYLGLNFAGAPSTAQVQIRWKNILIDSVQTLGGSEPVYAREETMDSMFQVRVSFRLPLDMSGTQFSDIVVTGTKCPTLFEAESEASIVALQELQHGRLRILIVDVSRTRCRELETVCYDILNDSADIYHAAKSALVYWEEDMHKVEVCYSPGRCRVAEDSCIGTQRTSDMRADVANQLASVIRASYQKLIELSDKIERVKNYIERARERTECFFHESSLDQMNEIRGTLPQELKLRMKLVLQEIIHAIGWPWPNFNVTSLGMNLYVCETSLLPNHVHIGSPPKIITITGPEAESEEEAIESCCKAAISLLERDKSICLVDLNFNHRSHGELYVVEAREAFQFASSMIPKIFEEWEAMVDEIQVCEEYCKKLPLNQSIEEEAEFLQGVKRTITDVAGLHEACRADLQLAKNLARNHGT